MTTIVHDKGYVWHTAYAYKDSLPELETFHSEAYVCGDIPSRYPVPAKLDIELTLWLEWYDNSDGWWDDDSAKYRYGEVSCD